MTIAFEAARVAELRRRLVETIPDLDDETLNDTLEGCSNLNELIAALIRSSLDDGDMVEAIKRRVDDLRERQNRFELRKERKREAARSAMEQAGIAKLVEPDCTISLREAPPSVIVTDEAAVPEWFWIPQPAKLDKVALLNTIKGGTPITGAELNNPRLILSVRTK